MTWVGWLILLAGVYLLIVLLRGTVQLVSWLVKEHLIEPRELRHPQERLPQRPKEPKTSRVSHKAARAPGDEANRRGPIHPPAATEVQARRPSRLRRLLKSLEMTVVKKGYDSWVASALAEEDLALKVEYLSKALRVNPTYFPAWGLKANALLGLKRYDEAAACFDKSLEMHATATAWCKKGACCLQLGRREEALRCFDAALKACPAEDRQLLEDATRMKKLAEGEPTTA